MLTKQLDDQKEKRRKILKAMDLRHEELAVVKNELDKHRQNLKDLNKRKSRSYEPGSNIEREIQSTMEQVERYQESFLKLKRAMDDDEGELKRIHKSIEECMVQMEYTLDNIKELKEKLNIHIQRLQQLKSNSIRRASLPELVQPEQTEHDDIRTIELDYWNLINKSKLMAKRLEEKCEILQNELNMFKEQNYNTL